MVDGWYVNTYQEALMCPFIFPKIKNLSSSSIQLLSLFSTYCTVLCVCLLAAGLLLHPIIVLHIKMHISHTGDCQLCLLN